LLRRPGALLSGSGEKSDAVRTESAKRVETGNAFLDQLDLPDGLRAFLGWQKGESVEVHMSISGTVDAGVRLRREELVKVQYGDAEHVTDYAEAYEGWGPSARYHRSRLHAIDEILRRCPGGALLDVGCGPGIMVRHLLESRPGDFRITACDQSQAMIDAVTRRVRPEEGVRLSVGDVVEMPYPDGAFDVVLAMGIIEYTDSAAALSEIARVLKPGGLAVATMLNPRSPYRLFEWGVFWPARRALGGVERVFGVPADRRHGARRTGIVALGPRRFRHLMWRAGLQAEDALFYDVTPLVPPVDRVVRRWSRGWREHPEKTVTRRAGKRWFGTGYVIAARRVADQV
jgi:SAM-dependent methyltransferase